MPDAVKPIPEGFHSVTPALCLRGAQEALDFYKRAFGATILGVNTMPNGKVIHADFRIGDSIIMCNDEMPEWGALSPLSEGGGRSISLHIYTEDADAMFNQAVAAGATPAMPMSDAFWGDRYGQVIDPYGHRWAIGTRKRNLTPEEIKKAQDEAMANMQPNCGKSEV